MKILWIYLSIINLFTFLIFGIDKYKARHHQWRISEKMLFGLCLFGGSLGALIAMALFNHKTQKTLFKYGVPLTIVMQIIFLIK